MNHDESYESESWITELLNHDHIIIIWSNQVLVADVTTVGPYTADRMPQFNGAAEVHQWPVFQYSNDLGPEP